MLKTVGRPPAHPCLLRHLEGALHVLKMPVTVSRNSSAQVVNLSSGLMEKLNIKIGSSEKEQKEDNSVVIRHQVCTVQLKNAFELLPGWTE